MSNKHLLRLRRAMSVTAACLLSAGVQAFDLDPDYGNAGVVTSFPGAGDNVALSVRVAPDGKIVLGGKSYTVAADEMAIARFNADGTPDASFAGDGTFSFNPCVGMQLGDGGASANLLAIQSDRKLVIATSCFDTVQNIELGRVIRLTENGAFDATFGTNGIVNLPSDLANGGSTPQGVSITANDLVLVTGTHASNVAAQQRGFVLRLTPSGALDGGFGGGEHLGPTGSRFSAVRVLADGGVVVSGSRRLTATDSDLLVERLLVDGTPDTTLDGTGTLQYSIGDSNDPTSEFCSDVAIRPNGTLLCAGAVSLDSPGSVTSAFVAQFTASGELDTTWGEEGVFYPEQQNPALDSAAYALTLRSAGDVLVAGLGIFPVQVETSGEAADLFPDIPTISSLATQADGNVVSATGAVLTPSFVSLRFLVEDLPAGDSEPDPFGFEDVVGTPYSTWVESEGIQITGLTSPAIVTIVGGEFSVECDGTFVDGSTATTIEDGQWICVRHLSAPGPGVITMSTLTIGGVDGTFSSITGDAMPDSFFFVDQTNVATSTLRYSDQVTISGIDIPAPISVVGGEYSIGCAEDGYTAEDDVILDGETVCVRHTSASTGETTVTTLLMVGNFTTGFSSTTQDDNAANPGGGGAGEPGDIGGGWNGGVGGGGGGSLDGLMLSGLLLGGGVMLGRRRQRSGAAQQG